MKLFTNQEEKTDDPMLQSISLNDPIEEKQDRSPSSYSSSASMTLFPSLADTEKKAIGSDDDDFELISLPYHEEAYSINKINRLLRYQMAALGFEILKITNDAVNVIYCLYQHKVTQQRVAVFPVVSDRDDSTFSTVKLLSLRYVLSIMEKHSDSMHKIIIPLQTSIISHYKLLTMTIDKDHSHGILHDAKSSTMNSVSGFGQAAIAGIVSHIQYNAPFPKYIAGYFESYSYIEATCKRFLQLKQFTQNCLNHQPFYNTIDSGVYIVAYAKLFLENTELSNATTIDVQAMREFQHILLTKDVDPITTANKTISTPRRKP